MWHAVIVAMLVSRRLNGEANRTVDAPPDLPHWAFTMWQYSETEPWMAEGRLCTLIA
jgi:hypothetical protein